MALAYTPYEQTSILPSMTDIMSMLQLLMGGLHSNADRKKPQEQLGATQPPRQMSGMPSAGMGGRQFGGMPQQPSQVGQRQMPGQVPPQPPRPPQPGQQGGQGQINPQLLMMLMQQMLQRR